MQWCGSLGVFVGGSMTWGNFVADLVAVCGGLAAALWCLGSLFFSSLGGCII
jgi:hypothetical protein